MNIYNAFKVFIRHEMLAGSFILGAAGTLTVDMSFLTPSYAGGPGTIQVLRKGSVAITILQKNPGTKTSSTLFFQRDINAATPSKIRTTPSSLKTSTHQKSSLFPVPSVAGSRIQPQSPATPTQYHTPVPASTTLKVLTIRTWVNSRTRMKLVQQRCSSI